MSQLIDNHGRKAGEQQRSSQNRPTAAQIEKKESSAVQTALMQAEERNVGAVTWSVYAKYFRSAGGLVWAPVIAVLLLLVEGNNSVFSLLF